MSDVGRTRPTRSPDIRELLRATCADKVRWTQAEAEQFLELRTEEADPWTADTLAATLGSMKPAAPPHLADRR